MSNYPKGSMGEQDAKNQKLAAVLFILGFIALHACAIFIPEQTYFASWQFPLTIAAVVALVILCISLCNNGSLTEDYKWPHVVVIVLAFASAVCIFYRPGL